MSSSICFRRLAVISADAVVLRLLLGYMLARHITKTGLAECTDKMRTEVPCPSVGASLHLSFQAADLGLAPPGFEGHEYPPHFAGSGQGQQPVS